jgi:hypothetical protein
MERTALNLPLAPQTLAKPRERVFASHLTLYICVVLVAAVASYAVWARTRSIFSCSANGYSADRYIAYCAGANYGDYEHGAFWFNLEHELDFASEADVLFLGTSRMEKAFSTTATADWFSAASARYYLMGFSYGEHVSFAEALLGKMHPRASVYVIDVEDFFDPILTPPAQTVLYDPKAPARYEGKQFWQQVQQRVCKTVPKLCGSKGVTFRSRETGVYDMEGAPRDIVPVSFNDVVSRDAVDRDTAAAIDFLKRFTHGRCVILTLVPQVETKVGDANAIAAALGMKLVTPDVPEGLQMMDGHHLDDASAERWSRAFFTAVGPEIRSCLEHHGEGALR